MRIISEPKQMEINKHLKAALKELLEKLFPGMTVNVENVGSMFERGDSDNNILFVISITGHTVKKDIKAPPEG